MPLIDDRGRLFGKVNLIDAIVAVFVLMLIPLAYGAFLLFRVPVPTITAIEPATITQGQLVTIRVTGQDLRPFLRARFGAMDSPGFLVQSPTQAEIKVPDLAVGAHDLTLYDEGQELLRVPAAVTVVPSPPRAPAATATASVRARFLVPAEVAPLVKAGDTDAGNQTGTDAGRAVLTAIDPNRKTMNALTFVARYQFEQPLTVLDVTLQVPVVLTPAGWQHRGQVVKAGAVSTFETDTYSVQGWILDVSVASDTPVVSR